MGHAKVQAGIELKQLHFGQQSRGQPGTPEKAERSVEDNRVWQPDTPDTNKKPWTGAYAEVVVKSHRKYITAGAEH